MNVIDTNVWIYLNDRRDPRKHAIAKNVVDTCTNLILPWQVGCEFISASKKLVPFGFTEEDSWDTLLDMQNTAVGILLPQPDDWIEARSLQKSHTLSFWDAILVGACIREGIRTLYTEDMGSPRKIGSLELINPFA
jgi:predicted nucleic acid-binding protein